MDLIVFDPHTHPEDDFARFDHLGRMILEEKPNSIVIGGDLGRVDSMSRHGDKPPCTFREDLNAMHEALRRMLGPLKEWNERQRSHRHKPWEPRIVWLEGNHEERARRVAKEDPYGFSSLVDWDDPFGFARWFDERYEFGQYANVGGIKYTHIPRTIMGRPMAHTSICKHTSGHLIYGHGHTLNCTTVAINDHSNSVRVILSAPCFMPDQNKEPYAKHLTTGWVFGLLRVYPSGSPTVPFGFDYVSMPQLQERYG